MLTKEETKILRDMALIKAQVADVAIRERMLSACADQLVAIAKAKAAQGDLNLEGGVTPPSKADKK